MKTLKGVSARLLNQKHKDRISKVLWGSHIWSPSYYIATTSDNDKYISDLDMNDLLSKQKLKKTNSTVGTTGI